MKQEERQKRSRDAILQAGLAVFGKKTYGDVTIGEICETHQISKGMFYHYFTGKDDLFLYCVRHVCDMLAAYLQANFHWHTTDGLLLLEQYFSLRRAFFAATPAYQFLFESAIFTPPEHLKAQIHDCRAALKACNHTMIAEILHHLPLRENISHAQALAYFTSIESHFSQILETYTSHYAQTNPSETQLYEFLHLLFFGVADTH